MYLAGLANDKDFAEFPNDVVTVLAKEGLRYLNTRVDFWRQQNPGTKITSHANNDTTVIAENNGKGAVVGRKSSKSVSKKDDKKRKETRMIEVAH